MDPSAYPSTHDDWELWMVYRLRDKFPVKSYPGSYEAVMPCAGTGLGPRLWGQHGAEYNAEHSRVCVVGREYERFRVRFGPLQGRYPA